MSQPLDWTDEVRELGDNGRSVLRKANAGERQRLAEALDVLSVESLVLDYRLAPLGEGRCVLEGQLTAGVTQACVVSLEPVAASIAEPVRIELWPWQLLSQRQETGERAVLGEADPEPLPASGRIETGRLAFEMLSAALDPYPRKAGAELAWTGDPEDPGTRPFAALVKLKRERDA
jgi:hypothetical protein